ncbi:hypothetical protein B7463_g6012, partial [Scytalidium lignicola]
MGWTEKGFFANMPQDAQPGDKVTILAGGKVPLILRPRGSSLYQLVGDAYVHDIMAGEAWDPSICRVIYLI